MEVWSITIGRRIPMGKFIDAGCVPEDDPMFNGSWMIHSVRRSTQSTTIGQSEKPEAPKENAAASKKTAAHPEVNQPVIP
jgi:hypothetical protein